MSESPASRPALQPLPTNPMNRRTIPSSIFDTRPSPLWINPEEIAASASAREKAEDALTPPITPDSRQRTMKTCADSMILSDLAKDTNAKVGDAESDALESAIVSFADITPKPYFGTYLLDSVPALGQGAWSTVRRATETHYPSPPADENSSSFLTLTPPSSPQGRGRCSNAVLAIKSPSRRDALPVLKHEARILTYLHQHAAASKYILAFRGWDISKSSLVLVAYPQTLDQFVKGVDASLVGPTDPVMGRSAWVSLVQSLVSALAFLHGVNCVHGDIKPSNVLLSSGSTDSSQPILADFSSSHIIPVNGDTSLIPEVSAITTEYTSPELLAAMLPKDPRRAVASFASDIYGLGVTLLEAAVGEKPYANAKTFMKLTMAREGRVVDFMSGESRRVGREVRGLVGGACVGKEENRWSTGKWMQIMAGGWKD